MNVPDLFNATNELHDFACQLENHRPWQHHRNSGKAYPKVHKLGITLCLAPLKRQAVDTNCTSELCSSPTSREKEVAMTHTVECRTS